MQDKIKDLENKIAEYKNNASTRDKTMKLLNDEIEELNFEKITEDTSFYLNEKNNVVINFDILQAMSWLFSQKVLRKPCDRKMLSIYLLASHILYTFVAI